jgi:hypothetical protein
MEPYCRLNRLLLLLFTSILLLAAFRSMSAIVDEGSADAALPMLTRCSFRIRFISAMLWGSE